MEITHDILVSLGFTEMENKFQCYIYKGVTGYLDVDLGVFRFHGFYPAIALVQDMLYMLTLINYTYPTTSNLNGNEQSLFSNNLN